MLEETLSRLTEHWKVILGPVLVLVVLFAKGGIAGAVDAWRMRGMSAFQLLAAADRFARKVTERLEVRRLWSPALRRWLDRLRGTSMPCCVCPTVISFWRRAGSCGRAARRSLQLIPSHATAISRSRSSYGATP
jgi:hypothetical protein